MPSWNSLAGVWHPAQEKVAITNEKGEPEIYEGPDRAALIQNKEEGIGERGVHFTRDTEFINRVRQVFNMSMDEYCKANGFDEKTTKAEFDKSMKKVNTHKDPTRKAAGKFASGGRNTAGNSGHLEGDFGTLDDAKSKIK